MDDRQDTGRPPAPEGMESPSTQLVRYEGELRQVRTAPPSHGIVWCVVGALLGTVAPPFAAYFAALGCAMLSGGDARILRVAVVTSPLCVLGLLLGAEAPDVLVGISSYLAGCLIGVVVARRGTSVTALTIAVVALGCALIAIDVWRASLAETSLESVLSTELDAVVDAYAQQTGIAGTSALETAREVAMMLWPMSYLLIAAFSAICALLGARAGLRRAGTDSPRLPLSRLDSPLWVVGVLAGSILAVSLGVLMGEGGRRVVMIGLNALMVVRVVLALDGMGVIAWFFVRMGVGRLGMALILALAVNIELSLPIVSGLGLVDFWANFRRLARGTTPVGGPQS